MLLIFPPGWSLNYGSPHLSLPLIKGFLNTKNIPCDIIDLNIESAMFYKVNISEDEIIKHNQQYDEQKSWEFYFNRINQLQQIAEQYDGTWDVRDGFVFNGCDLASSNDLLTYSKKESPFTDLYKKRVLSYVKEKKPAIIGLGAVIPSQLLSAFEIIRLLRNSGYSGKIILGGNTATRLKEALVKVDEIFELIDGIIVYQGEHALADYYTALDESNFDAVPNLIWKKNGVITYNKERKVAIEELAMADFTGYPINEYWGINYLPIIGTRGCYYGKCTFCTIPYVWGKGGFAGFDKAENVFEHMIAAKKRWKINRFSFVEETLSPIKLRAIAKLIVESGETFCFEGYARFEESWLNEELVAYLSKSGLKKLFLGLELLSKRDVMNKGINRRPIPDYLRLFKRYNIKVHLFILNGYPGTTVEDSIETMNFLIKHKEYIDTIDVSYFVWDLHTKHEGVEKIVDKRKDLALHFDYNSKSNLNSNQTRELAMAVEQVVMSKNPKWVDPLYRVYSTWADTV
ncbi:hypothetical protein HOA92_00895 [archaeon]|nr:hypothetical protein [archaeon]MBT6761575.1 hypothetical protein [archaeon]